MGAGGQLAEGNETPIQLHMSQYRINFRYFLVEREQLKTVQLTLPKQKNRNPLTFTIIAFETQIIKRGIGQKYL